MEWLKDNKPMYQEIVDFYRKVKAEQERVRPFIKIDSILLRKEWKELFIRDGLPPLKEQRFPVDIETSVLLFLSLCQIAREANPFMLEQIGKIEEALGSKRIDLKELLKNGIQEQKIEQFAREFELSKKVFLFLIQESVKPSIEAAVEQFRDEINPEAWFKGCCPICGSIPYLSVLKDKIGKRFLLCSHCQYEWRIDRLTCPFCNNMEQGTLHYFYEKGEDTCRIDLCEKCHRYIKTIDLRENVELDPFLEELTSLHLDILAWQNGFTRPSSHPYWAILEKTLPD